MLTVIIPCGGHHAKYVNDAVQSCLNGTERPERIIVVDDCARPPVRLARHDVVSVLSATQHIGRSAARNWAARSTDTEWLYFLDADDMLEPTAIADFKSLLHHSPDIIYADYQYLDQQGVKQVVEKKMFTRRPTDCHNYYNIGMFVKRERFELIGGFDDDMAMAEYWDFFLRYTANEKVRIMKHTRPFFTARQNASVSPNAYTALRRGCEKITAMIRGQYYYPWRKV